jgi:hypothetical protein
MHPAALGVSLYAVRCRECIGTSDRDHIVGHGTNPLGSTSMKA